MQSNVIFTHYIWKGNVEREDSETVFVALRLFGIPNLTKPQFRRRNGIDRSTPCGSGDAIPGAGARQALQAVPRMGLPERGAAAESACHCYPRGGWKRERRRGRGADRGAAEAGDRVELQRGSG